MGKKRVQTAYDGISMEIDSVLVISKGVDLPSIRNTPLARAASTMRLASLALIAMGFSTRTCLPAAIASSAFWQCMT